MSVGRRMIMGAAGAFALADINLATSEFTDALAGSKGWVDNYTVTWQTTSVRLHTVLNQIGFPGNIYNEAVSLKIGKQYVFRAYFSAKTGSGTPGVKVTVLDGGGVVSTTTQTTTGQWVSVTFTPDEVGNNFLVSANNPTNTDSTVTITAVQLYRA